MIMYRQMVSLSKFGAGRKERDGKSILSVVKLVVLTVFVILFGIYVNYATIANSVDRRFLRLQ